MKGDLPEAARQASWLVLATLAETGIRAGNRVLWALLGGGAAATLAADKELRNFAKKAGIEMLNNVPFMSNVISMAVYQGDVFAAASPLRDMGEGAVRMTTGKKPVTKAKGAIQLAEGAGSLAGIPGTKQAGQAARAALSGGEEKTLKAKLSDARKRGDWTEARRLSSEISRQKREKKAAKKAEAGTVPRTNVAPRRMTQEEFFR